MSPEFGSTIAVFPIDEETIELPRLTGRSDEQLALVEAYAKEQGLWHDPAAEPRYSERLELDLADRRPVAGRPEAPAGPGRGDRGQGAFRGALADYVDGDERRTGYDEASPSPSRPPTRRATATATAPPTALARHRRRSAEQPGDGHLDGRQVEIDHGAVAIAAITSCTNTSNPSVMIGAALLAKNAVEKGLQRKPWVKTHAGARLEGRHRLLRAGRPHAVPRQARLQPRRLRLHDLHRQLRPADPRGQRRRSTSTTSRSSRCCRATATSRAGSTPT